MTRLGLLAIFAVATAACAQPTSPPNNASQTSNGVPLVWQPYTTVTVYIDGNSFPSGSAMEAAVRQGFINNQAAYSPNDGVSYSFVDVTSIPSLTQNTVYVTTGAQQVPTNGSSTGVFEDAQFNAPSFNSVYGEDFMTSGTLTINSALVNSGQFQSTAGVTYAASHGDSHYDGVGDCPSCLAGSTVMSYQNAFPTPSITGPQSSDVSTQSGDQSATCRNNPCACNSSGPGCGCSNSCESPSCSGYNANECNCIASGQCGGVCDSNGCTCTQSGKPGCPTAACENGEWTCLDSPIVIDVKGEGFRFTSAKDGVSFDFFGDGSQVRVSWTDPAYSNAWLVLDRNGNGRIDDAREMFGNITEQPVSNAPNGYLALAEYDKVANGGNANGFIDPGDAIYSKLRLWIDANHNGVSEPNELYTLAQWNVLKIGLTYETRERTDRFGNIFRYRARIWDRKGKTPDRWTYDVFLQQASAQ